VRFHLRTLMIVVANVAVVLWLATQVSPFLLPLYAVLLGIFMQAHVARYFKRLVRRSPESGGPRVYLARTRGVLGMFTIINVFAVFGSLISLRGLLLPVDEREAILDVLKQFVTLFRRPDELQLFVSWMITGARLVGTSPELSLSDLLDPGIGMILSTGTFFMTTWSWFIRDFSLIPTDPRRLVRLVKAISGL